MNIPRYLYNENVKNDFLRFLKEADEAKSDIYCNFKKHEQIISLLPLHGEVKQDLKTYMENANICIDITQSDDEAELNCKPLQEKGNNHMKEAFNSILSNSFQNLEQTNINDIIESIKDSLCMQNEVSNIIFKDLSNLSNANLDIVFSSLINQLSIEEVEIFSTSLMGNNIHNDYVILCYLRFLFLPKAKQEFTFKLETIFLSLSQKYTTIIKNELVNVLLATDPTKNETNRVLQQYIGNLKNDFKTDVLRHFLYRCEKLHQSYIPVIEVLLNTQSDYDLLGKLVEVMSNAVTEFTIDNAYGKLLFNVVNLLERNVSRLEQPLKHILGIHKSIWKIKVQKVVVTWFDDSLTQSFA